MLWEKQMWNGLNTKEIDTTKKVYKVNHLFKWNSKYVGLQVCHLLIILQGMRFTVRWFKGTKISF